MILDQNSYIKTIKKIYNLLIIILYCFPVFISEEKMEPEKENLNSYIKRFDNISNTFVKVEKVTGFSDFVNTQQTWKG